MTCQLLSDGFPGAVRVMDRLLPRTLFPTPCPIPVPCVPAPPPVPSLLFLPLLPLPSLSFVLPTLVISSSSSLLPLFLILPLTLCTSLHPSPTSPSRNCASFYSHPLPTSRLPFCGAGAPELRVYVCVCGLTPAVSFFGLLPVGCRGKTMLTVLHGPCTVATLHCLTGSFVTELRFIHMLAYKRRCK